MPLDPGFKKLVAAFTEVTGSCTPYSITGSLPCIADLQDDGFDVQTMGFGKLAAYHANNEVGAALGGREGARGLLGWGRGQGAAGLQGDGFGVQAMGFGKLAAYHASNEVGRPPPCCRALRRAPAAPCRPL
jgi:hypothetical protein